MWAGYPPYIRITTQLHIQLIYIVHFCGCLKTIKSMKILGKQSSKYQLLVIFSFRFHFVFSNHITASQVLELGAEDQGLKPPVLSVTSQDSHLYPYKLSIISNTPTFDQVPIILCLCTYSYIHTYICNYGVCQLTS